MRPYRFQMYEDGVSYKMDDGCIFYKSYPNAKLDISGMEIGLNIKSLKDFFEKYPLTKDEKNNIMMFNCSSNLLENLEGIPNFPNLQKLYCYENKITDLKCLSSMNLSKLKVLVCSHNQLKNLDGLPNLPDLEELDCCHNKIKNLLGIPNLPKLKELNCSRNEITSFAGLRLSGLVFSEFKNLWKIDFSHNEIENFKDLDPMNFPSLEVFRFAFNRIKSFEGLNSKSFPNLKELNFSYNQ